MDSARIEVALHALLAGYGRERLITLALGCARFVLARALGPDRQLEDLRACEAAMLESWAFYDDHHPLHEAATAVCTAAELAESAADKDDASVVSEVLACVQRTAAAVELAWAIASAQERLELVARMDGHSTFENLLLIWVAEGGGPRPGQSLAGGGLFGHGP